MKIVAYKRVTYREGGSRRTRRASGPARRAVLKYVKKINAKIQYSVRILFPIHAFNTYFSVNEFSAPEFVLSIGQCGKDRI